MNKPQSHRLPFDLRSAGLWSQRQTQPRQLTLNPHGSIAIRENFRRRSQRPYSGHFIFTHVPCSAALRHVTIPIAEAAQWLRGLVQHVLSPHRSFADDSEP